VGKEDVGVENKFPVCVYRINVQSFSVSDRAFLCCVCKHKVRRSEVPLLLT
jgi:hypothetical protein